jgi:hypothetical protein
MEFKFSLFPDDCPHSETSSYDPGSLKRFYNASGMRTVSISVAKPNRI